jgi:hypothetical protein
MPIGIDFRKLANPEDRQNTVYSPLGATNASSNLPFLRIDQATGLVFYHGYVERVGPVNEAALHAASFTSAFTTRLKLVTVN